MKIHNIIFIHGLESSGKGFKGRFLKEKIPYILTPDFQEYSPRIPIATLLKQRMQQLITILTKKDHWILIGSSFGGLMATLFALQYPAKVEKLILLAPYLAHSELDPKKFHPIDVQVLVYHGSRDQVVLLNASLKRAKELFVNLEYNIVDDDHFLHNTMLNLNWKRIILK